MELDSDDDDTILPPLFKNYDGGSDDKSDEDSDNSGCDGSISSGDNDDVMHDLESLVYLYDSIAHMKNERWDHKRLNWDKHVRKLEHEGSFNNKYRMSLLAHGELNCILHPILERKKTTVDVLSR